MLEVDWRGMPHIRSIRTRAEPAAALYTARRQSVPPSRLLRRRMDIHIDIDGQLGHKKRQFGQILQLAGISGSVATDPPCFCIVASAYVRALIRFVAKLL